MVKEKKKKYSKFRTKILRALLLIGIAPLLTIFFISLIIMINTRLEDIAELQQQVIDGAEENIERYLDQKLSVFNLVINKEPDDISEIAQEDLEFLAKGLKEAAEDVNEITFISKAGQELIKDSDIHQKEFYSLRNVSQNEDFKTAINGQDYLGSVNYTLAGPVMRLASRIENKNRQIIGVISAEISLKPLEKEILAIKSGNQGFVYLLDKQGNLIASSNQQLANQGENLKYNPLVEEILLASVHNGLLAEDRYENILGQKVIFAGRQIERVNWPIVSEWSWQEAMSAVVVIINQFLLVILVSLFSIIFFSLFFVWLVARPVEVLTKGTDEISQGNFDYKINIRTGDELERLGEKFNKMAKVLKENQKLKDEFVFVAAHELRAPVTVIKGYLSMILDGDFGKFDQEIKKPLETMAHLNEGLVGLVHDLLEIARSEAGRLEIKTEPVSIKSLVKEIVEAFQVSSQKKGLKLIYQEADQDFKVMADPYKLKEVLTNLISNAIKYTLQKGTIKISHEIKGNFLITHIGDEGMGIGKEDMAKLFSKFHRAKTEETKNIEGTGLGLFICKEIITRMKGKIWAESQLGKGSTFSFTLPLSS